ncbi:MAG TPA: POTRA domain-containing protein [Pyrinomonadaceae bacterium]|nr:POTRA domain-containing protein [Pyrinomonadaceae bacterium]
MALCAFVCLNTTTLKAQDAWKFDEFKDLTSDDAMARLDLFAAELAKRPAAQGLIVSYRAKNFMRGLRSREVYGFHYYLVNKRGIDPRQTGVLEAGVREENLTELWILPRGVNPPVASVTAPKLDAPMQFDSVWLGDSCVGEFTLVPEEPKDALKFFALALREDPEAKGFVLIHPATRGSFRNVTKLAGDSLLTLTRHYQIPPETIASHVESPRRCAQIDLWLAPAEMVIPKSTSPATFFESQLMADAERESYAVRRVEFIGNEHTRDHIIRRRMLQNEGDVFRRSLLEQSLKNVSRLRNLRPVDIRDVEVRLNRDNKSIDFAIYLVERRRHSSERL